MRIMDLLESEELTRWLLIIDDKPVAHYPSKAEAMKIKRQLTLKLGTKYKIDIKQVPHGQYKISENTSC